MSGLKDLIRNCSNEKGLSLASVIFTILILGAIGLSMSPVVSTVSRSSVLELQGEQAFFVAEGGLQYILQAAFQTSNDFTTVGSSPTGAPFGGTPITLSPGQFWVQYANLTTNTADVTATGKVGNSVRQVQQSITKVYSTSGGFHSGGSTTLGSDQGGGGQVIGPVTYGTSFSADAGYTLTDTAQQGAPPPPVSLTSLIGFTTSTITGNYTLPTNYSGNLHVTGNVTINTPGTITGIVVADGSINITVQQNQTLNLNGTLAAGGDMTLNFQQYTSGTFTAQPVGGNLQPLLVAVHDINFSDFQFATTTFNGLILAGNNVDFKLRQSDTMTINGGVTAGGDITSDSKQGSVLTVNFDGGTQYLGSSLKLTSWKEL